MVDNKFTRILSGIFLCSIIVIGHTAERKNIGIKQNEGLSLIVGLEYESGDYGTSSRTDLWRIPVGISYLKGRLIAGINTALLHAKSNGVIITSGRMGGGMSNVFRSSSTGTSATGIGDVKMYASYQIQTLDEAEISYHVTGRVKFGNADENKGLGTGENDYAIEGGVLTQFQNMFFFGNIGYQITGDSPTVNYKNVWYANAGTTYPLSVERSIGAMLEVSQSANPSFAAPAQLTLFVNQDLANQRQLYFYILLGLSNGSPDSGVGANMTFKL